MTTVKNYLNDEAAMTRFATLILSSVAFALPVYQKAATICIILFVVLTFLKKGFGRQIKYALAVKANMISIVFYLLHVFGLIYSVNYPYALADLQTKLSFLLFPLFIPAYHFTKKEFRQIMLSFVAGCILAGIICLIHALFSYAKSNDVHDLVYMKYSFLLHPTYFAFYLNLAFILLLGDLIITTVEFSKVHIAIYVASLAFIIFNILFVSARTATAVAYLTILAFVFLCLKLKKSYRKGIPVLLISLVLTGLIQYGVMKIGSERVKQIGEMMDHNKHDYNSATIRVHLWNDAWEVIREHPVFGVGTGDIKEALIEKYKKNDFSLGVERNYSPHNQLLHTMVILGAVGLMVLLLVFIFPAILAVKGKDWIYFLFLVIVFLNCMTEDVLEVQAGIIFFSFFNCLFCNRIMKEQTMLS